MYYLFILFPRHDPVLGYNDAMVVVKVFPNIPFSERFEIAQRTVTEVHQFLMNLVEMVEESPQLVIESGAAGTFDVLGR